MMQKGAILMAALLAMSTAAEAQEVWGAVAADGQRNFGVAVGMATREAAEISARAECGGGPTCIIRLAAPARCVSYAHSGNGEASGYGAGPTKDAAEQSAWNECNARVLADSCTIRSGRCFD
ncbi:MAG: DUF4189 domain-containing protein [Reyranella sp.]|nr:MAG: DUF4189 domain-containing protein [Reyranella sp.]